MLVDCGLHAGTLAGGAAATDRPMRKVPPVCSGVPHTRGCVRFRRRRRRRRRKRSGGCSRHSSEGGACPPPPPPASAGQNRVPNAGGDRQPAATVAGGKRGHMGAGGAEERQGGGLGEVGGRQEGVARQVPQHSLALGMWDGRKGGGGRISGKRGDADEGGRGGHLIFFRWDPDPCRSAGARGWAGAGGNARTRGAATPVNGPSADRRQRREATWSCWPRVRQRPTRDQGGKEDRCTSDTSIHTINCVKS